MDKLQMAHDYAMQLVASPDYDDDMSLVDFVAHVWKYADAMQAEADKRKPSGLPEALCEVDWRVAPSWAKYWAVRDGGYEALWCVNKPTVTDDCLLSHGGCSPAPSFGFTGSHIVERPHGF